MATQQQQQPKSAVQQQQQQQQQVQVAMPGFGMPMHAQPTQSLMYGYPSYGIKLSSLIG
jgi:hypothetical protein